MLYLLLGMVFVMSHQISIEPYGPRGSEVEIFAIEEKLGVRLPEDYRDFLLEVNGGYPARSGADAVRFQIHWRNQPWAASFPYASLDCLYTSSSVPEMSLARIRDDKLWSQIRGTVPRDTIPIGRDRSSNAILLGIKGENRGKVFFWVNDYASTDDDAEPTYDNVGFIANSFSEFLESLYPWKEDSK